MTMTNQRGVKHYVVVSTLAPLLTVAEGELQINVVRTRNLGSIPVRITKTFPETIRFSEAIKKIATLCELDDDIFNMLAEHTK